MIEMGSHVYLKGCPHGVPGTVVRIERNRAVVLWADLGPTYIGRHRPDSLMEADTPQNTPQPTIPKDPSVSTSIGCADETLRHNSVRLGEMGERG